MSQDLNNTVMNTQLTINEDLHRLLYDYLSLEDAIVKNTPEAEKNTVKGYFEETLDNILIPIAADFANQIRSEIASGKK